MQKIQNQHTVYPPPAQNPDFRHNTCCNLKLKHMSIMAPVAGVVQAKPIFQYNGKNIMKKNRKLSFRSTPNAHA